MQLAQAYAECERIIRANSSSFYHAFGSLAQAERDAVYAVYAFCRRIDHIVDAKPTASAQEQTVSREAQLDTVATQLMTARTGRWPTDDAVWCALCDVFRRFPMRFEPFFDMLEGQRRDLAFVQPATLAELESYCYLVAGTVGLMLLPILAPQRISRLRRSAIALGIAMQLTNILRDVREDALMGRVYLPHEWLNDARVNAVDLISPTPPGGWPDIAKRLEARARDLYRLGLRSWSLYPEDSRLPVTAAGVIYRGILDEIAARDWDVFAQRVVLSDDKKRALALAAFS